MNQPPLDVSKIIQSHSSLTAVLAGFALAGLFLLMDKKPSGASIQESVQYNRSMLLLFLGFVVGSLSSFLYSSMSGFSVNRILSYYIFQFPSALFAINSAVLLTGVSLMFTALNMGSVEKPSRIITYLIVVFGVFSINKDLSFAFDFYQFQEATKPFLYMLAIIPGILIVILLFHNIKRIQIVERALNWVQGKTFNAFVYVTITLSLSLAFINAWLNYHVNPEPQPQLWILSLSMTAVSIISCWSVYLIPISSLEK